MNLQRVCVFCGSSAGVRGEYRAVAEALARELAARKIDLVFGGGCVGLMGIIADATLAAGGHAIGVIPHALVAMPGGFGTFEEFCEVVTWTQLGLHRKRCGLLNVGGFYDPLLALFNHASAEGFIRPQNLNIIVADADPAVLLDRLSAPLEASEEKWLRSAEQT